MGHPCGLQVTSYPLVSAGGRVGVLSGGSRSAASWLICGRRTAGLEAWVVLPSVACCCTLGSLHPCCCLPLPNLGHAAQRERSTQSSCVQAVGCCALTALRPCCVARPWSRRVTTEARRRRGGRGVGWEPYLPPTTEALPVLGVPAST